MEQEIKIYLVPGKQLGERKDFIRITCGDITAFGETLQEAIEEFDYKLEDKDMIHM